MMLYFTGFLFECDYCFSDYFIFEFSYNIICCSKGVEDKIKVLFRKIMLIYFPSHLNEGIVRNSFGRRTKEKVSRNEFSTMMFWSIGENRALIS